MVEDEGLLLSYEEIFTGGERDLHEDEHGENRCRADPKFHTTRRMRCSVEM